MLIRRNVLKTLDMVDILCQNNQVFLVLYQSSQFICLICVPVIDASSIFVYFLIGKDID